MQMFENLKDWLFHPDWGGHAHLRQWLFHPDWGEHPQDGDSGLFDNPVRRETKDHNAHGMQMFDTLRKWLFHPDWGEQDTTAGEDYRLGSYTPMGTDSDPTNTLVKPKPKYKDTPWPRAPSSVSALAPLVSSASVASTVSVTASPPVLSASSVASTFSIGASSLTSAFVSGTSVANCDLETHYGMQLIECVRLWLFHPDWGEKDHISATPRMDEQPTACVKEQTIKDYKAKYKDSVSHMHAFRAKFLRGCRVPRRRRRRSGRARTARSASTRPPQDGPAAVRAARLTGRPFSRATHTRPAMRISGTYRETVLLHATDRPAAPSTDGAMRRGTRLAFYPTGLGRPPERGGGC